jgi:hypothetical protein
MVDEMLHRGPGRPRKEPEGEAPVRRDVPVTDTPEFQEALARAKAELHAEFGPIIDAVKQSRGDPAIVGDDRSFAREMALAIAEIADGDQGRKRTPPAELAKRAAARAKMDAAISTARRAVADYKATTGEKHNPGPNAPLYLATGKSHLDETLISTFEVDPATKKPYPVSFNWLAAPNEAMRPLNEAAKEIYKYFMESIGGQSELVAPQAQAWISAGGLVIQGIHGTPVNRQAPDPEQLASDFYIRGPGEFDPRRDRINVLGTIAEPARQMAMGAPEPRKGV